MMNRKIQLRHSTILLVLLFSTYYSMAQSVSNSVIGSTGEYGQGNWGSLAYTSGELIIATGNSPMVQLTQGFHQPDATGGIWVGRTPNDVEFKIFPNPAHSFAYIETSLSSGEFYLYNQLGQLVIHTKYIPKRIELTNYPTGVYNFVARGEELKYLGKLIVY